jgi:saccharopine dehydrogenase (NAD+, L-lysine-forming)
MTWLLYGATGYAGRLIARRATAQGLRPVLAGRSSAKLVPLAAELGLEHRVFPLDDPAAVRRGLKGVAAVAHCAGPFARTAVPMATACIDTGTHYLDITGEIDVFEALHALGGRARQAGITLLPGAGFDVVATDCLAALLAERLPDATQLDLAFLAGGGASPGSARTALEGASEGRIRAGGEIRTVPVGSRRVRAAFPSGARTVVSVPWGDVSTAYHSTGIPDITTYTALPAPAVAASRVLRVGPLRGALSGAAGKLVRGPGERTLNASRCEVWGRARDAAGNTVTATLTGPNPYRLTADSVLRIVERLPALPAGFQTPSLALGARFAGTLDEVTVTMAALR